METIQGNSLVYTVEPVVRDFTRDAIETITPWVKAWFEEFKALIEHAIRLTLDSKETPLMCRNVGAKLIDSCLDNALSRSISKAT